MKADFSGWATRVGLKCTDGRTIMEDAFKHQHQTQVPLVWQHGHSNPENVLGHALLENREGGVYAHAFFNDTPAGKHARIAVEHKDINSLSIWANQLIEQSKRVLHGSIREVSLVLAGANPGAVIENVTIRHSDSDLEALEDEAIIHTGLTFTDGEDVDFDDKTKEEPTVEHKEDEKKEESKEEPKVDSKEKVQHADDSTDDDASIKEVYDSMNQQQKDVLHYMLGQALEAAPDDNNSDSAEHNNKEGNSMSRSNVFEQSDKSDEKSTVLSHDELKVIVATGAKRGSMKEAFADYALAHNITDIDQLFPDARNVSDVPEWIKRRTEWVVDILAGVRKSPFARIRTLNADITMESARAKGYIKGTLKKEEFFPVAKRTTTPTTIYKKQTLDRDDVLDITDFDVVVWLKAEMRIMLDEELARAILIGDGRDISDEDKINEQNIRPIATDNELYTTTITVNVADASSSMIEVLDAVTMHRALLKGTGSPSFYTTEYWIARFMTLRDNDNRRMFKNLDELAQELRVTKIIPVEAMLEVPDIIGIMVNPTDYVLGADKGGQVSMFDDFDIDYNKQKYLIETRCSGALVKIKSAMVVKATAGANVLVAPNEPTFDEETGVLTIVNQTGVVYKNAAGTVLNAAGSPYAAIDPGASMTVFATPASGYYFASSDNDTFVFTREA